MGKFVNKYNERIMKNMSLLYKLSNEKIYKLGYFLILINAIGAFTSIALTSLSMILGILILFILEFKNKETSERSCRHVLKA